jgi:hypothetical protein
MHHSHADDIHWDAVRAQRSYRVFIWVYRLWLAVIVGLGIAVIARPAPLALWVVASGAAGAASVVALLAVSLRRAGVPVLRGLTDPVLAAIIIFDDLFGELRPGGAARR